MSVSLNRRTNESHGNSLPKCITLQNDYLQTVQRVTALVTVLLPAVGTVIAIGSLPLIGCSSAIWILMAVFYVLTLIGLALGHHRLFSHCSFRTYPSIRAGLAILGSMAAQGPVIHWVSNHRRHHQFCDQMGDPHSPHACGDQHRGQLWALWHAHMGWLFTNEVTNAGLFAKDLLKDSLIARISQLYLMWVLLGLLIPTVLGGILTGSWVGLLQGFLWGGLVRIFVVHHVIWSVNSCSHWWGQRPLVSRDQSTNNMWLAIPTLGESWHHNHHVFPNSAYAGLEWWQIDMAGWILRCLEYFGCVWDVKRPSNEMIAAKKL